MKKRNARAVLCTFSVIGFSVMTGTAAMAAEDSDRITIPYLQEKAWDELVMTNDDAVSTGVNIRATADENSEIIGYLYQGGAAWVLNKGDEWTEISSGGVTGFVKNEYLLYGRDVIGLADHYGLEGVKTTWDDVNLYASENNTSEAMATIDSGTYYPLVAEDGKWLTVQNCADDTACVSSEDVSRVLILDTAVSKDDVYEGAAVPADDSYSEETSAEPTYTETEPSNDYSEPSNSETEAPSYDYSEPTYTETEPSYDYTETEAPSYDYSDDTSYDDTTADDTDGGYYDADTDTYYDANGNVSGSDYNSSYTETEAPQTEAYVETEAPQTEAPQTEAPQTEAPQTEAASTSSDDVSLLAAIIYCEAGNQSYEGMVAVGAVVMNRVYSSSFPNSISEVIYQSGQFTPASSGVLASALANGVPSTCYDAAVAAMNGENPVGSALYFNTGSGKGIKIGAHQFY